MQYSKRIAALFMLLPLSLLALSLLSPGAQAAVATLERLSGQPVIYEIGAAGARHVSLPKLGAQYRLPIEIETGADDHVMFRLPDSDVSVAPHSIMRIAAPESQPGGLLQRVLQTTGSALFSVDRRTVEHFQVDTPFLATVVKGTMFTVVVHDQGATVSLHEGKLEVNSPDGKQGVELLPGDVAFAGQDRIVQKLQHTLARDDASRTSAQVANRGAALGSADPAVAGDDRWVSDVVSTDSTLGPENPSVASVPGNTGTVDDIADSLSGSAGGGGIALGAGTGNVAADLGEVGADLTADVTGTTGELVGGLTETAGELVGGLTATAGDLVGGLTETTGDLVGGLTESTGELAGDLTATTGALAGDLVGTTGDLVGGLTETTGDLAGDLTDPTGDLVGDLTGATGDLSGDPLGTQDLTGGVGELVDSEGISGLLGAGLGF